MTRKEKNNMDERYTFEVLAISIYRIDELGDGKVNLAFVHQEAAEEFIKMVHSFYEQPMHTATFKVKK